MDFGASSVSGPRPYNEDNYLIQDLSDYKRSLGGLTAFVLVSDGMGGHSSGDVASRVAVEIAEGYIGDLIGMAQHSHIELDVAQALHEIVDEAHAAVLRAAEENGAASMGATFVAAFMSDRKAWIGHVGDSRAYVLHDGTARQVTVDHSQVGRMIAEGILTEEQAQHHPQRNVIERALGFQGATAEITEVALHSGDAIVLCSDGLSTVLSAGDIVQIAISCASADEAARQLTAEAIHAGTDDNTTAVVASDDWSLFRMSAPQLKHSRREASKARREAAKHRRASAKSWYIAAAVVLVGVAALWFAMRSASSGAVATGGGAVSTETASPEMVKQNEHKKPAISSDTTRPLPAAVTVDDDVSRGAWLRSEPSLETSVQVASLKPATILRPQGIVRTGNDEFYQFKAFDISPDVLDELKHADMKWPGDLDLVYCWTGAFVGAGD